MATPAILVHLTSCATPTTSRTCYVNQQFRRPLIVIHPCHSPENLLDCSSSLTDRKRICCFSFSRTEATKHRKKRPEELNRKICRTRRIPGGNGNRYDRRNVNMVSVNCEFYRGLPIDEQFAKLDAMRKNHGIAMKLVNDSHRPIDEKIHDRTVPGYATLIGSYCRSERWGEVFSLLGLMVRDGILPDKYLVPTILKACSAVRFLKYGKMVHGYAVRLQLEKDIVVGNALMNFYGNCFNMIYSRNVFDTIQEKDVVSWSSLISSYMNIGLVEEAEHSFHEMQLNGVNPDVITWNALVSGFARNGEIESAIVYLNGFIPNVTSWNGIISGFVQNRCFEEALDMFSEMVNFPENPNAVTIVSILPACSFPLGRAIHGYAIKKKLHENILVAGSVMNMYSKCGAFDCTEKVFAQTQNKNTALWNEIIASHVERGKIGIALEFIASMQESGLEPDEISYNTILSGYARNGKKNEAYDLLSKMSPTIVSFNVLISGFQQSGLSHEALTSFIILQSHSTITLNSVTISSILAACADLNMLTLGKEIHGYILRNSYESNIFISTAVIDMYAKCRDISSAVKVFEGMESRNTVSWNSLINGHIQNDNPEEAFKLFNEMLDHGAEPSLITFMILISVCVEMTELLSVGRSLHGYILKTRNMRSNKPLVNAVIAMYVKCGCISDGKCVFDSVIGRDDSQWNKIVSGLLSNP